MLLFSRSALSISLFRERNDEDLTREMMAGAFGVPPGHSRFSWLGVRVDDPPQVRFAEPPSVHGGEPGDTARREPFLESAHRPNTKRMRATCAYDGTEFHGWMIQEGRRTVQGTIEERLRRYFKRHVQIAGSGRTDAGVSARAQVFHIDVDTSCEANELLKVLQSGLPPSIQVTGVVDASYSFHARHSCLGKRYTYTILTRQANPFEARWCWSLGERLTHGEARCVDTDAMAEACAHLVGTHDFSSFCVIADDDPRSPVRHMWHAEITHDPAGWVRFTAEADRFLYKQMRMLAGTLVQVGLGKLSVADFVKLLDEPEAGGERRRQVTTAPARGLMLEHVFYGDEGQKGTPSTVPATPSPQSHV